MKPFLILQIRPNDEASDSEFEAFLEFGKLKKEEVKRIRLEQNGLPEINLEDYSGVILGGGPTCVSVPDEQKSPEEKKFEADLNTLFDEIVKRDFPYFGECYGFGFLAKHQEGLVSKEKYDEIPGPAEQQLEFTKEAEQDDLCKNLDKNFNAFVGHKEACQKMPEGATLLVTSPQCPYQMFKLKNNIYAAQFHPVLDTEGIILRINVYKHAGYFPPEDAQKLIDKCKNYKVSVPQILLERFVAKYRVK